MNNKQFLDELIYHSIENLKKIESVPNVDFNLPDYMYNEFNSEVKSAKIAHKDHSSEYYDKDKEINISKN